MYFITLLLPRVVVATRVVTSSRPKIDHGSPQNETQPYLFLKRNFRDLDYILGPKLDCSRRHWMRSVCLILRFGQEYHHQTLNADNAHVSNDEGVLHIGKHRSASLLPGSMFCLFTFNTNPALQNFPQDFVPEWSLKILLWSRESLYPNVRS